MCGIIGYTGQEAQAASVLLHGLHRLEYRGYDSAGVAIVGAGGLEVVKRAGRVDLLGELPQPRGETGIGHTRWATHGRPSDENAHPHVSCDGAIAVVHNGIIENYRALREQLSDAGHKFQSETDTEAFAHLVEEAYKTATPIQGSRLLSAVITSAKKLEGSYAFAVVCEHEPGTIVAVRNKSPLIVGLGKDANFLASDVPALLDHTNRVIYLLDGEVAYLTAQDVRILSLDGERQKPVVHEVTWSIEDAEKGGYEHFMLKEIHETPRAIHEVLRGRVNTIEQTLDIEGNLTAEDISSADRVLILACGTSYHAGLVGKQIIERLVRIPVDVVQASEFRYGEAFASPSTLAIAISQSGETADTLEAMRKARLLEHRLLAITNVVGSTLTREAEGVLYLRSGPEIGVAATKTFVSTVASFYLLAFHMAAAKHSLPATERRRLIAELKALPRTAQQVLDNAQAYLDVGKNVLAPAKDAFYIGRQIAYGVAVEAALKLKEISYIHAEGFPAGELKHGPLALLEPGIPVVAFITDDPTHAVMLSNVAECRAREAHVIAIGPEHDVHLAKSATTVLHVPDVDPLFFPVPAVLASYLLAYAAAAARGCDIDKPRNLAKSVTVE
ncbi:MAG: glutamine--fructose-6-phosphate transaminase (isomerizing) [Thermoplasmatota archaeon]